MKGQTWRGLFPLIQITEKIDKTESMRGVLNSCKYASTKFIIEELALGETYYHSE